MPVLYKFAILKYGLRSANQKSALNDVILRSQVSLEGNRLSWAPLALSQSTKEVPFLASAKSCHPKFCWQGCITTPNHFIVVTRFMPAGLHSSQMVPGIQFLHCF
jgi:hypothetical protein